MNLSTPIRALLLLTLAAGAQDTGPKTAVPAAIAKPKPRVPRAAKANEPAYNTNLVVLDPAHGGADKGASLGADSFEAEANLALANRLKPLLEAKGFTVILTHSAATDDVNTDQRVELANRSKAIACLLLHASNGGHGVHLYTSALAPLHASQSADDQQQVLPWDTAQAAVEPQSLRLTNDLAAALNGIRIPLVVGQSSVKPIDSLSCPAVAIEVAPLNPNGDSSTPASDPGYQARVAESIATALVFWRGHVISNAAAAEAAKAILAPPAATPPPVKPRPKPKPPAALAPGNPDSPAPKAAPIVRKSPPIPAPPPPGAL